MNGYTDSTPIGPGLRNQGVTTNLILSEKRANNVMQYMISQGVKPELVSAQGFGEADPVASNDTPEGKAKNRRVELTLWGRTRRRRRSRSYRKNSVKEYIIKLMSAAVRVRASVP